jgi:hypothetical protein
LGELTTMTKQRARKVGLIAQSAIEDAWQRKATEAAIAAARGVVKHDGPIPPLTPIGRLSDIEWGWIVAAVLFGWIRTRAEQATAENLDAELTIRASGLEADPWDAGAVLAMLPDLANACPDLDWSKPLTSWSRETMTEFLLTALRLVRQAMLARDCSEQGITREANASVIARQANAAAGGPLMTPNEWDDPIGF